MTTDEALAIIEHNNPCAHESYEEAGFNFRKCCDCGVTLANEDAARAGQGARAYEDACGTMHTELARLREIEQCARDFLRVYDDSAIVLFDRYTPPLRAALAPKDPRPTPSPAAFHGDVPDDSNTGF